MNPRRGGRNGISGRLRPVEQYGTYEAYVVVMKEDDPIAALASISRFPGFSFSPLVDKYETARRAVSEHAKTVATLSDWDAAIASVRSKHEPEDDQVGEEPLSETPATSVPYTSNQLTGKRAAPRSLPLQPYSARSRSESVTSIPT